MSDVVKVDKMLKLASGLSHFRRLPFRLFNGGTCYGLMMRTLLNGLIGVDNYVDDIVVQTKTWPKHLAVFFEVFLSVSIMVKPSSCCHRYSKIYFVGHQVGVGPLMTQDDEVERVQGAPVPQTVTQVRSFMGRIGHYRKLTGKYASTATPLRK